MAKAKNTTEVTSTETNVTSTETTETTSAETKETKKKKTIFELGSSYVELEELLEDDDITEAEFKEKLLELNIDTDAKIERYLELANEYTARGNAEIAYAKAAEDAISKKKKAGEADINKAKAMKNAVIAVLKVRGDKQFIGKLFKATIKKNQPSLEYDSLDDIPDEFKTPQEPKLDTNKLKNYLKDLEAEKKTCEFARLKYSESLVIK
jgi:hypothetical protein